MRYSLLAYTARELANRDVVHPATAAVTLQVLGTVLRTENGEQPTARDWRDKIRSSRQRLCAEYNPQPLPAGGHREDRPTGRASERITVERRNARKSVAERGFGRPLAGIKP